MTHDVVLAATLRHRNRATNIFFAQSRLSPRFPAAGDEAGLTGIRAARSRVTQIPI
jgi:hypothetical protein